MLLVDGELGRVGDVVALSSNICPLVDDMGMDACEFIATGFIFFLLESSGSSFDESILSFLRFELTGLSVVSIFGSSCVETRSLWNRVPC